MSIWDKYKVNDLPEEQRADVIKKIVEEVEESNRAKISDSNYQTVRGMVVGACIIALIPIGIVAYNWVDTWRAIKMAEHVPFVCPPPPAQAPPAFDIKVVPVPAAK